MSKKITSSIHLNGSCYVMEDEAETLSLAGHPVVLQQVGLNSKYIIRVD